MLRSIISLVLIFFMATTSKKLEGHIAFGSFIGPFFRSFYDRILKFYMWNQDGQ